MSKLPEAEQPLAIEGQLHNIGHQVDDNAGVKISDNRKGQVPYGCFFSTGFKSLKIMNIVDFWRKNKYDNN